MWYLNILLDISPTSIRCITKTNISRNVPDVRRLQCWPKGSEHLTDQHASTFFNRFAALRWWRSASSAAFIHLKLKNVWFVHLLQQLICICTRLSALFSNPRLLDGVEACSGQLGPSFSDDSIITDIPAKLRRMFILRENSKMKETFKYVKCSDNYGHYCIWYI